MGLFECADVSLYRGLLSDVACNKRRFSSGLLPSRQSCQTFPFFQVVCELDQALLLTLHFILLSLPLLRPPPPPFDFFLLHQEIFLPFVLLLQEIHTTRLKKNLSMHSHTHTCWRCAVCAYACTRVEASWSLIKPITLTLYWSLVLRACSLAISVVKTLPPPPPPPPLSPAPQRPPYRISKSSDPSFTRFMPWKKQSRSVIHQLARFSFHLQLDQIYLMKHNFTGYKS